MDERTLRADSSIFGSTMPDSIAIPQAQKSMDKKEWISGITIVLVFSITLLLLFNLRSR
jgi:hypothetical protein